MPSSDDCSFQPGSSTETIGAARTGGTSSSVAASASRAGNAVGSEDRARKSERWVDTRHALYDPAVVSLEPDTAGGVMFRLLLLLFLVLGVSPAAAGMLIVLNKSDHQAALIDPADHHV